MSWSEYYKTPHKTQKQNTYSSEGAHTPSIEHRNAVCWQNCSKDTDGLFCCTNVRLRGRDGWRQAILIRLRKRRTAQSQAGQQPSLKKQMEVHLLNEITQDMFTSDSITVWVRQTNPAPVCCSLKRAPCWFLFWEQQGESTFVTAGTKWPTVQTQFIDGRAVAPRTVSSLLWL